MYKLFYSPFSCSLAVHMALQKIDVAFELEKIDVRKGMNQKEAFLKLNKHGQVPLLQDKGQFIDQGASILLYLADKHQNSNILPSIGQPGRAGAISTLFYMSNTLHPTFSMVFHPDRFTLGEPTDVFNKAIEKIKDILSELNQEIENKLFLSGDQPFAADYYFITMMNWLQLYKISLEHYPNLRSYKQRMGDLPEVSRAVEIEIVEL